MKELDQLTDEAVANMSEEELKAHLDGILTKMDNHCAKQSAAMKEAGDALEAKNINKFKEISKNIKEEAKKFKE